MSPRFLKKLPRWTAAFAAPLLLAAEAAETAPPERKSGWRSAPSRLMTPWAERVSPETAHREYPRPTLVRGDWLCLNGLWEFAVTLRETDAPRPPERFEGQILVPFPIEAPLSGVGRRLSSSEYLWYRRSIDVPGAFRSQRILLHFGAVDWEAEVFLDGSSLGLHRGGYDAFSFDVTEALRGEGKHELLVRVWDPTDEGSQPRGKQVREPRDIWYTPSSGIWQTVWLEPVPATYIRELSVEPSLARAEVRARAEVAGGEAGSTNTSRLRVRLRAPAAKLADRSFAVEGVEASGAPGEAILLRVPEPKAWSPSEPWLYDLEASLEEATDAGWRALDRVRSYFGLRDVSIARDSSGIARISFNGSFRFQLGVLDQGFWPDGLYAAPSDEALRFDIELAKRLGFEMARKHVKVEPERWYFWCDRLGLLVWQDMPSGGGPAPWPRDGTEISRSPDSAAQFRRELEALVRGRGNHPSIAAWVIFNEGWGQFETRRAVELVRELDRTRLVIAASGGNDMGGGDAHDIHVYPGPAAPPAERGRASALGEFGALGLPIPGHLHTERNWSSKTQRTPESLSEELVHLLGELRPLAESRLSAAVYTQLCDLEAEFNGFVTYDRRVVKIDAAAIAAAAAALRTPPPPQSPASLARAATVAWWRFEPSDSEGAGSLLEDASGQGNHLVSPKGLAPPRPGRDVSERSLPGTGDPNRGSLDATGPGENWLATSGTPRPWSPLEGFHFAEWTVEASFRIQETGRFHAIVGKDGKPTGSPLAPLQLKVRGDDGRIQVEAIDESGIAREIRSREPAKPGVWYRVAAASDGESMTLYVDRGDGAGYELQGRSRFEGALFPSWDLWTVGRGFFDGRPADRARASIDEVRVVAAALDPSTFLFARPKK